MIHHQGMWRGGAAFGTWPNMAGGSESAWHALPESTLAWTSSLKSVEVAASLKGKKIPIGRRTYNSLLVRKTHDHRNSCKFSAWVIGVGKDRGDLLGNYLHTLGVFQDGESEIFHLT